MIIWGYWFGGLFAVFLAFEIPAALGIAPWKTLSRTVWMSEARYHFIALLTGIAVGGLAAHFFGQPGQHRGALWALIPAFVAGLAGHKLMSRLPLFGFLVGSLAGGSIIYALGWTPWV